MTLTLDMDGLLRTLVIVAISIIIIQHSTRFEDEYHTKLAHLYTYPWWRILVVLLLISAAMWCPWVGVLAAVVIFFYLSDMNLLMTPIPNL